MICGLEGTLWVKLTSWSAGSSVSADGVGVVAHSGSVATCLLADRTGLTNELSRAMVRGNVNSGHDRGRVLAEVVVMLVDGGEAIAQIPAAHRKKLLIRSLPGLIDKTPATGAFCST